MNNAMVGAIDTSPVGDNDAGTFSKKYPGTNTLHPQCLHSICSE